MHTLLPTLNGHGVVLADAGLIGRSQTLVLADAGPSGRRGRIDGYDVTVVLMFLITIFALRRLWRRR